jgi:CxxC-x17-CxxC domain-containing protein
MTMKPFNNKGKKFGKGPGGKRDNKGFGRPRSGFGGGYEGGHDRHDNDRSNNRGGMGGAPFGGGLYKAICADCGQECEVPFKPTGSKPVYCRSCFKQNEALESDNRFDDHRRKPMGRPRFDSRRGPGPGPGGFSGGGGGASREALEEINRKLDKIIEALDIEE